MAASRSLRACNRISTSWVTSCARPRSPCDPGEVQQRAQSGTGELVEIHASSSGVRGLSRSRRNARPYVESLVRPSSRQADDAWYEPSSSRGVAGRRARTRRLRRPEACASYPDDIAHRRAASATPTASTPSSAPHGARTVTVLGSGDVLIHPPVWEQAAADARAEGRTGFDFDPMFAAVAPVTRGVDLAICEMETPLAPPQGPFAGSRRSALRRRC